MKITIWDILTVILLLLTVIVGGGMALLFLQPNSSLNPFQPPTVPASIVLPSSTATQRIMPPTWTPLVSPSNTPMASSTWAYPTKLVFIPSVTLSPTATLTYTPSKTPTSTRAIPTYTKTASYTPNVNATNTAAAAAKTAAAAQTNAAATQYAAQTNAAATLRVSQTNVAASATAAYLTAVAAQTNTAATATQALLPANPTAAYDINGATNDGPWQKIYSDPYFGWSEPVGANGYYIYWGPNQYGNTGGLVTVNEYDPPSVTTGIYYLRIRTRFSWGFERQDWTTIFIYRYDGAGPTNPNSVNEWNGKPSGEWQNSYSNPGFTLSGASDGSGSGLKQYNIYWGTDPLGVSATDTITASDTSTTFDFDPPAVTAGAYYLRVQTVDKLDNPSAAWATMYAFCFDNVLPSNPPNLDEQEHNSSHSTPTFLWNPSEDVDSGVDYYEIYWGINPIGEDTTFTYIAPTPEPPPPDPTPVPVQVLKFEIQTALTINTSYYFRVRAVDKAKNKSDWSTYTYVYTGGVNPTAIP